MIALIWKGKRARSNARRQPNLPLSERARSWWQQLRSRKEEAEILEDPDAEDENGEVEAPAESGWWQWIAWGTAAICLGIFGLLVLNLGDYEQGVTVRRFEYKGIARMTDAQVLQASGVRYGTNLTAIDRDAVSRAVERLPWVRQADVETQLPDRVVFRVVEYKPYALLLGEGKTMIVDQDGFVFKQAELGEAGDLPIITGFSTTLTRDAHVRAARSEETPEQHHLREVLRLIDAHAHSEIADRFPLSEVHWDPVLGTTLVGALDGAEVRLSRALQADPGKAFALMQRVLRQVDKDGDWLRYALFDDELRPDRVVVRTEKMPAGGVLPGGASAVALPKAPTSSQRIELKEESATEDDADD